jgi:hypothetical protein
MKIFETHGVTTGSTPVVLRYLVQILTCTVYNLVQMSLYLVLPICILVRNIRQTHGQLSQWAHLHTKSNTCACMYACVSLSTDRHFVCGMWSKNHVRDEILPPSTEYCSTQYSSSIELQWSSTVRVPKCAPRSQRSVRLVRSSLVRVSDFCQIESEKTWGSD